MTENIHAGHRKRMRERFEADGFTGFSEHEVLEFLLFSSLPRINTNDIAHKLIIKFGSLENVLSAALKELETVDNIGSKSSMLIKTSYELHKYLKRSEVKKGSDFSTVEGSYEYIKECFTNDSVEKFIVFFLDKANRLTGWKIMATGTACCVNINDRELMKEAVLREAVSVVIAHNHPGGTLEASKDDISLTENLSVQLAHIRVNLKDHFIITDDGYFSFYEKGYI